MAYSKLVTRISLPSNSPCLPTPPSRTSFRACSLQTTPSPNPVATSFSYTPPLITIPLPPTILPFEDARNTKSMEELKEKVHKAIQTCIDSVFKMRMIDTIQRLGLGYHFEVEIKEELARFSEWSAGDDLFATALHFRLLRHNGCPASSGVFRKFTEKNGRFKESLIKDIKGILSLYEASYLGAKSEDTLMEAMEFTRNGLIQSIPDPAVAPEWWSDLHISRALELPRHLRMARLEARSYIEEYSKEISCNFDLLEMAKLDFNTVQLLHQTELSEIFRWWKQLGLVEKLSFARNRPLECYLWTVGIFSEPHQSTSRIELTKTIAILLVIDDIFDTYGSLDELILFTDIIRRWDLCAMEQLPEYMKICYMALYNTTHDIAYRVIKEHGWSNILLQLKRTWIDLFEAQLLEAKWFNKGYVPTLEEYLANGVTSGGTYMALVHAFYLMGMGVTAQTTAPLDPYPTLFSCSGKILRLWDDLGTATEEKERGDVESSIECYMRENPNSSEDEARKNIKKLISNLWIELNGELITENAMPRPIVTAALNLSRTSQAIYQHGDDNKIPGVKEHVQTLFYRPVA